MIVVYKKKLLKSDNRNLRYCKNKRGTVFVTQCTYLLILVRMGMDG